MVTLFMTQRSLLLGMPLTLIVLGYLWKVFYRRDGETERRCNSRFKVDNSSFSAIRPPFSVHRWPFGRNLAADPSSQPRGPLITGVFLFILKPERWKEWLAFALGVAVIAVPELAWTMSGSATKATEFFAWHFGWDSGKTNFFVFWIKNTGPCNTGIDSRDGDSLYLSEKGR